MRAIILAGGKGSRWNKHLGIFKHFLKINNETLIERMVRLLLERNVSEIYIVGPNEEYKIPHTNLYIPILKNEYYDADKFLSSKELWNPNGRTIVLFGDVYFTDDAMDKIVYNKDTKWHVYGRPDGSKLTGKKYGELFAQSFYPVDIKNHEEKLFYIIELYKKKIIKRCIGWEHYRAMQNAIGRNVNLHKIYNNFFVIDDWTDDFDNPNDYENFIKNWKNKNQF